MEQSLVRCLRLANKAGLEAVEIGEFDGLPALLNCGQTLLHEFGLNQMVLHCSPSGKRVLLQTAPHTYSDLPDHPLGNVLVDLARISDEELQLHIEQAAHECRQK